MQSAALRQWTLSFQNGRLEVFYQQYALRTLLQQARIALLVGTIIYGLYSGLDFLFVPAAVIVKIWYVRMLVILVAFGALMLTFYRRFMRYSQSMLAIVGLLAGLGLLVKMWWLSDLAVNYFYAGLILITFWCHSFSGLRFLYATTVSFAILLVFNIMFGMLRPLPMVSIISYNFFLLGANLFGAFSSYISEKQSRLLFLREKELDRERYLQRERALHDGLTGLPNRELLRDRIDQAIHYSLRTGQVCAGIFLDLDKFKPINDTYGHAIGDMVLQTVAMRLKSVMREADTLSRLGGDEFFVLAQDIHTPEAAEMLAYKLQQQIEAPLMLQGVPPITDLSASIGICIFPYENVTAVDVIRRADQAMYQIKRGAKAGTAFAA
ncbi:MAG TPA: GGDEF domain-containing protein [Methylophilaceae bacterium]|nr:GGDEF domain-containing protein [Methylophilaceae bacterium]